MKFTKVKGLDAYRCGDYEVAVRDLGTPFYGSSGSPRRLHEATATYRGGEIARCRSSRMGALGDIKAIAEHHARPQRDCPSTGCTSHHDNPNGGVK
jgi:hypothetical protein